MKASILLLPLSAAALTSASVVPSAKRQAPITISVSYDKNYDVADSSLTTVSCSDGTNGLLARGYSTFGSLPSFPNIGGAPTVAGWNDPNCGKCYTLSYASSNLAGSVNVLAIDAAPGGFNLGLDAMNTLTGGNAQQLGRVDATYVEADPSICGL